MPRSLPFSDNSHFFPLLFIVSFVCVCLSFSFLSFFVVVVDFFYLFVCLFVVVASVCRCFPFKSQLITVVCVCDYGQH